MISNPAPTNSVVSVETLAVTAGVCQAPTELSSLQARMAGIFAADGLLARYLPGYEPRAGQLAMARAVAATLEAAREQLPEATAGEEPAGDAPANPSHLLLAEAGTGTGKTLAYLVPAVLSGRRVVISTNTINLQEQILAKEIPFIQRYLAPWLKALCVKGRGNYLCLRRWHQVQAGGRQGRLFAGGTPPPVGAEELPLVAAWLEETESGDRSQLPGLADDSLLWATISSASGQCLGTSCPHHGECFITRLRQRAARAHLLIVNHHLFFSDLAVRRSGHAEVLPRYEAVIFDEAHHLENIATRHFGLSFSHYQVLDLVRDLENMAEEQLPDPDRTRLLQAARMLGVEARRLADFFPGRRGRYPLPPLLAEHPDWPGLRRDLEDALTVLARQLDSLARNQELWGPLLRRTTELGNTFQAIVSPPVPDSSSSSSFSTDSGSNSNFNSRSGSGSNEAIYWYESLEKTVLLGCSPIDIAPHLQEHLHSQVQAAVFTSATLQTGGDFSYVRRRLGLPAECPSLALETPFDYAGRTLLYVPEADFPLPAAPDYPQRSWRLMREILSHSRGRALLLFTSVNAMRQAATSLGANLPYPVLVQGDAPRPVLLEQFRRRTRSILLAVASFWEGVDVPGESLSCVIIDKLPFEVPGDPVIMARIEKVRAAGGNPFFDFQVPRAVLMLRQGVGRLLRGAADQGLLAILDVRLFNKSYGRTFLRSLPPSPVCRDLEQVKKFFEQEQQRCNPKP